MSRPYSSEFYNIIINEVAPGTVHINNNLLTSYIRYNLYNKILANFEFENFPNEWSLDYFKSVLFLLGFIGVFDTAEYGTVPQKCGLKGYNIYYQPRQLLLATPFTGLNGNYTIGENCRLLKLTPDFVGVTSLISYYREKMALCAEAADINVINSKLAYVMKARSKAERSTLKQMYDQIASGTPAVFVDDAVISGTPWETFSNNLQANFIAPDMAELYRTYEREFLKAAGYQTRNEDKKERLITSEVERSNDARTSNASLWVDTFNRSAEEMGRLFPKFAGLKMKIKERSGYNGKTETNINSNGEI